MSIEAQHNDFLRITLILERTDEHGTILDSRKYGARLNQSALGFVDAVTEYAANTIRQELPVFLGSYEPKGAKK